MPNNNSTVDKVAKWVKLVGGSIALVAALWAGFGILYGLRAEVNRLRVTVGWMDSTVVKNMNYRKRQICKANGYVAERFELCPLLRKEMGDEEIEPAGTSASLPTIQQ